jgi:hypothetical protein
MVATRAAVAVGLAAMATPVPPCGIHQPKIFQAEDGSWHIRTWAGGSAPIGEAHVVIDGHIAARIEHMGMPDDVKPKTLAGIFNQWRRETEKLRASEKKKQHDD